MDGYIGKDLVIRGAVRGEDDLAIDGSVHGQVDLLGRVEVGASGLVGGDVHCTQLFVSGEIRGPVSASIVEVRAGGIIAGDVHTERLSIDDEGAVQGVIRMEFEVDGRSTGRGAR